MDVLGNLANVGPEIDEDEEDEDKEEEIEEEVSRIHNKIISQGGARSIIECLAGPCRSDSSVLMSALESLSVLCGIEDICIEKIVPLGLLEELMDITKQFDWDDGIMEKATGLIVVLTYFEECVDTLAELGVIDVLVGALEMHANNHDILMNCQLAFTNLSINFEEQEYLVKRGALDAMLQHLTKLSDEDNTNTDEQTIEKQLSLNAEVLSTLTRLSCTDEFSVIVGERGMGEILGSYASHEEHPQYITSLFTLVSQLAFQKENLQPIIQYGGIKYAIDAVSRFPDEAELVVQAVQLVDNCATATPESASIVSSIGGQELFDTVITTFKDHPGFEVRLIYFIVLSLPLDIDGFLTKKQLSTFSIFISSFFSLL